MDIAAPDHEFIIVPGKVSPATLVNDTLTDRLGINGLDDGPDTWAPATRLPAPIKFSEVFAQYSPTYFDPKGGKATGWSTTRNLAPDMKRCNYTMAAIIYDTDPSRIPAFNCANTGGCTFDWMDAIGVVKNIPAPKLVPNEKGVLKMKWGNRPASQGKGLNGWTEADFNTAFNCSPGNNSMICYDMPFQRDYRGLWTFDSDFLCKGGGLDLRSKRVQTYTDATGLCTGTGELGGGPALGFFPNRLNRDGEIGKNEDPPLNSTCTYATCDVCAKKYAADPMAPLHTVASARAKNCPKDWKGDDNLEFPINPMCYELSRKTNSTPQRVNNDWIQRPK